MRVSLAIFAVSVAGPALAHPRPVQEKPSAIRKTTELIQELQSTPPQQPPTVLDTTGQFEFPSPQSVSRESTPRPMEFDNQTLPTANQFRSPPNHHSSRPPTPQGFPSHQDNNPVGASSNWHATSPILTNEPGGSLYPSMAEGASFNDARSGNRDTARVSHQAPREMPTRQRKKKPHSSSRTAHRSSRPHGERERGRSERGYDGYNEVEQNVYGDLNMEDMNRQIHSIDADRHQTEERQGFSVTPRTREKKSRRRSTRHDDTPRTVTSDPHAGPSNQDDGHDPSYADKRRRLSENPEDRHARSERHKKERQAEKDARRASERESRRERRRLAPPAGSTHHVNIFDGNYISAGDGVTFTNTVTLRDGRTIRYDPRLSRDHYNWSDATRQEVAEIEAWSEQQQAAGRRVERAAREHARRVTANARRVTENARRVTENATRLENLWRT